MTSATQRHVLHVGYPKAGTTFVKSWFLAHPQIHFAHGGFGGFTHVEAIQAEAAAVGDEVRCFATSSEQLIAMRPDVVHAEHIREAGAFVIAHQERICQMLATLFPGCSVLILTRGYRGAIRSSYSQYLKIGGWEWRLQDSHLDAPGGFWTAYLDYARVTALYGEHFGRDNVHVLPYELLLEDRQEFLRALERVAGVDPMDYDPGRLNPSLSPQGVYWYPRISRTVDAAVRRLPRRLGERVRRTYVERFALTGRLDSIVRALERVRPSAGRNEDDALDAGALRRAFAGRADALSRSPYFARFATDYLLDPGGPKAE